MEINSAFVSLTIAIGLLSLMYARIQFRHPLMMIAVFYVYFAFGPVVNWLLDQEIYFGTLTNKIEPATFIFLSGLVPICCLSLCSRSGRQRNLHLKLHRYPILVPVLIASIAFTLATLAIVTPSLAGDKVFKIQQMGAALHYNYLLIQYCIFPFFFLLKKNTLAFKLYLVNSVLYIFYCFVFGERDFIFILIVILFYRNLLSVSKPSIWKTIRFLILLSFLMFVATGIFVFRDANNTLNGDSLLSSITSNILNQGSLLFVNTQILDWTDRGQDLMYGYTYFNSCLNLVPSWIFQTDFNLLTWFSDTYVPGSPAGSYGFAIDAEAYLNFGTFGPPLIFFGLALLQRTVFNRIEQHPFFLYFSVFYTSFFMYSLRNDSLALAKGSLYAAMLFWGVSLLSKPEKTADEPCRNY